MLVTRKAQELDVVELTEDLPEYDLKQGDRGAVIGAFGEPDEAYDLEFVDESGKSKFAYSVRPDQISTVFINAEDAFQRGLELIASGATLEGRRMLRQAVKVKPSLIETLLNSVLESFGDSEEWSQLVPVLRFIRELDPGYEIARNNLVIAYLNLGIRTAMNGDVEGALQAFYSASGIEVSQETLSWVKHNLAAAHIELGIRAHKRAIQEADPGASLEQYKITLTNMARACAIDPHDRTRKNLGLANAFLGNALLRSGDFSTANTFFEVAEDMGLAFPKLFNNHAIALAKLGHLEASIELLEKAIEMEPGNESAKTNLNQIKLALSEKKGEPGYRMEEIDISFDQAPQMHFYEYQVAA
ncbi:MAG TPA: DUF4926 domain-containing protein [Blastocatellia bacterium]|jgi:tetratricopeptide (TPR) repeat protein|nr:DUF4926 domain-containing protein [Blastocatellia bacterium]